MPVEATPTAEGDLGRTPFAHLLVYAIDRRLTGALFLDEPRKGEDGTVRMLEHTIRLVRGAPVKVKPGDGYALLGELLVQAGALSEQTLKDALATKGLLGDVLMLAGCVDRDTLEGMAEKQFQMRMVRLFSISPETTYRYYDGHVALIDYGGDPSCADPLELLWAGLREHAEASTMLEGTLGLLGEGPIKLHAEGTYDRFGLGDTERALLEQVAQEPMTLQAILASGKLSEAAAKRLVYALMITRNVDLGRGAMPCGYDELSSRGKRAQATVAKMQLRSLAHRIGAAAPDAPGDGGERLPATPRRKTDSTRDVMADLRNEETVRDGDAEPSTTPVVSSEAGVPTPNVIELVNRLEQVEPISERSVSGERAIINEPTPQIASLPAAELFQLATARLEEKDMKGALEAATLASRAAPDEPDYRALAVWARAQMSGADNKALLVELDDVIRERESHVAARFYRAMLRKKLGDSPAAVRDLRRVIELAPSHADAARELAALDGPAPKQASPAGFFAKLFRR